MITRGIPYINNMRERIRKHTHPQDHQLSSLFQKKKRRQVSRLKGNKAQQVYDILFDEEKVSLSSISIRKLVTSLIEEHIKYARLEEEYTRTKIKNAIRNVGDRKWAQEKIKALEIENARYHYRMRQGLILILNLNSDDVSLNPTTIDLADTLENPHTYIQLSEQYTGWMDRIIA